MQVILSDQNCEGHARAIFDMVTYRGYLEWIPMELKRFDEVGLRRKADDETVWRFCQENSYLLLTDNRTGDDGQISLELTIRRLVTSESLRATLAWRVITIGNVGRVLARPEYCKRCADKLAEIVFELEKYKGITRLYIPS